MAPPTLDVVDEHALDDGAHTSVRRLLGMVREQLGMDLAFIGRFSQGNREIVRATDEGGGDGGLTGWSVPLEETYCRLIAAGEADEVVGDAQAHPVLSQIPHVAELGIGAYAGVPIVLDDGTVYGTLCAVAHRKMPELAHADAAGLRLLAAVLGDRISERRRRLLATQAAAQEVDALLRSDRLVSYGQPVVDLDTARVAGIEALLRVGDDDRGPLWWLEQARRSDRLPALEAEAVRAAGRLQRTLSGAPWLAVNVSAPALLDEEVRAALAGLDHRLLVVELTEHGLADPTELSRRVEEVRAAGARIALDDVGAHHATLERILRLRPDIIKVDRVLVSGCAHDRAKRALLRAVRGLSQELGASLVAEGIETDEDLVTIRDLGIRLGQGFLLGRPDPAPAETFPPERRIDLAGLERAS